MDKLTLAHDYYMQNIKIGKYVSGSEAWNYADAMFEEAEKREKEDAAKKRAEIREMLNSNNTFIEREGQHFDDVNWQPDWSLAPDDAVACAMDPDLEMWWCSYEPVRSCVSWDSNSKISEYPNHNYTGNWRNSLRIRPSSK